ncbi:MAG TPA: 30S ribosomal protein S1 [Terriglobales bacterium]|nr:30S ribosomal protein S1 [Terriglobales bacterium]
MPNSNNPELKKPSDTSDETGESFKDLLAQYEQSHARKKKEEGGQQFEGTVISVSADTVYVDIGRKSEGIIPLTVFAASGQPVQKGDRFPVSITGRNEEGYYELSRTKVATPTDWPALEKAFAEKATIVGTVTGVVKGGVSVDVGVRAFMPASRSATRDAAELAGLVEQQIRCRIIKLDVSDEDVVVDRRAVVEEEERAAHERRFGELREGAVVTGTVRSLMDYGAFVDLGGVDALLHVSDIGWGRVNKPADVLTVGQQVEAKILKISTEGDKRRISIGMKQLQADPWTAVAGTYKSGEKVRGTVTRVMDFGAFVELEPGVEGLIHISEMSWGRKVRKASDMVKPGDAVEAVILNVNLTEKRISLGLKQALGDPWEDAAQKFPVGSVVSGPVTNLTKFGAFVQLREGVEGMIHVSDISAEKRINHPQDVLKVGETVKAQVLAFDREKRQIKLGIKQLAPTDLDEYLAEQKPGDVVTGRVIEIAGDRAQVELGQGILADCKVTAPAEAASESSAKADLSSLSSMLQSKWKGAASGPSKPEPLRAGQIRSFRITRLDREGKKIEVQLE